MKVDRAEPENAPYVKDEMNRIIYQRFKGHVVSKEHADTELYIDYRGSSFSPLTYTNGYVTRYRANIRVHFTMVTPKGRLSKSITAIHEADIQESSLTSSTLRIEAIRVGLQKALDEFLAYASAKGVLSEE
ncbi:MAG: LPS assembly lipoprotein LptE [Sulfurovum sp.]|nr:LPS assembly lipoprotein LptE [Sulfurovum sp.]